ncbi:MULTISPECIES: threonine synthase [Clostridium]|uniref:Threonine synthase n=2 Tax=Clostridium TaxID=1485 RepID=A0A151ANH9_9CLOT|nr:MULTISPECIES: threonine synthase [Clostridium]KYH29178.1 threonine synthase [Clostridium colicanis DSM 13634]MBE6043714.1 threonine synthase [Clostridium thermopalmarium]PRR74004.1 Threonine synthase [Clostridium thermopalmarium DSM 5974]PVZ20925.1 threonine synthase [Clostridium thermopalmarium DSM 5974]
MRWMGLIDKYREFLPVNENTKIISLCEGNTPLIRAENIEKLMPGIQVYLKYEGLNPTGSFKDRGMTMAVTKAVEEGSKAIICASTGNTSAAAAAYAAKAGIKSIVIIPNKKIAMGKLAQALAYGAKIIAIDGNFDDALNMVKEISKKHPITLVNSINPYRIEGQKTAAFEICEQLGKNPDYVSIPVGNAGNITAYWKGFKEFKEKGKIDNLPKMLGFQAEGAAPIVDDKIVENPETIATAIRIGNPASWKKAVVALEESKGIIDKISDEKILEAYKMLSSLEGIFAEPASCISIAGLYKLYKEGKIKTNSSVVCILTGNGLKDPDTAVSSGGDIITLPCNYEVIEKEIVNR